MILSTKLISSPLLLILLIKFTFVWSALYFFILSVKFLKKFDSQTFTSNLKILMIKPANFEKFLIDWHETVCFMTQSIFTRNISSHINTNYPFFIDIISRKETSWQIFCSNNKISVQINILIVQTISVWMFLYLVKFKAAWKSLLRFGIVNGKLNM